ncbi:hypothetical protein VSR01_10890 [Actinacidiphila sp. DG2A-62]|uniref:hypothetical protein n=1 Tax=Actinacidiphila sp. DG2A-62 TaxID=3108821 RepID=UPI002DBC472A|nr:hypothetical protein [Actinacidiphila sp. DG2A-62]MEC3994025.1 hypothetical protein [Actinacidiphila sp. DG2A-62]
MHTRTAAAAGLLTAGLLLAACTSNTHHDTTATTPPATTAEPTTEAPTTPAAPTRYDIGQPWEWSSSTGADGTTTVLGYQQPVLRNDPPDTSLGVPAGSQWGRLDVKICLTSGPSIGVSQNPWHLGFADGSQADNTGLNGGDFPKPELPQDGTVVAGGCSRGGIMFPIPKGQRPTMVVYTPDGADEPVVWTIPAE